MFSTGRESKGANLCEMVYADPDVTIESKARRMAAPSSADLSCRAPSSRLQPSRRPRAASDFTDRHQGQDEVSVRIGELLRKHLDSVFYQSLPPTSSTGTNSLDVFEGTTPIARRAAGQCVSSDLSFRLFEESPRGVLVVAAPGEDCASRGDCTSRGNVDACEAPSHLCGHLELQPNESDSRNYIQLKTLSGSAQRSKHSLSGRLPCAHPGGGVCGECEAGQDSFRVMARLESPCEKQFASSSSDSDSERERIASVVVKMSASDM